MTLRAAPAAVRDATPADIGTLTRLMREFHAEAGYALDQNRAATAFATLLGDGTRGGAWLAFDADEAVGYVVLSLRWTMDHGGFAAHIDDLWVQPSRRRRGVGRALLDALVAHGRARGCRSLHVEVGAANAGARALYARYGLTPPDDDRLLLGGRLDSEPPLSTPVAAPDAAAAR